MESKQGAVTFVEEHWIGLHQLLLSPLIRFPSQSLCELIRVSKSPLQL